MPLSPSQTREILAQIDHLPRKHLGQNFLVDANIVRKSVELASVAATDRVVEIGPGLGTLTRALLSTGAQVWAIEHDPRLAAYLRTDVMPDAGGRLHLMEGDALDAPRAGLATNEAAAGFKVVANLPYAISTPWMDSMLADPLPQHMVLMLQREAADRYAAAPGSKQFGAISIFLQSAFDIAPGHKVPAACFHPRPDIESYLLNLVRKPVPYLFSPETKRLIRACFQQRRKQVSSLLRGKLPDDGQSWISTLTLEGLDGRARPEAIPTKAWQRLSVT